MLSYRIAVQPTCPSPHLAELVLNSTTFGYSFEDTFLLKIAQGTISFFDDFESSPNWTHGGTADLWNRTQQDYHSSSHSWFCGNTGSWQYENNMNCWLLSPEFISMESNSWLSFWLKLDVAVYGVDGIYVLLKNGTSEDTLDFIGSGGALEEVKSSFETGWAKYSYDLSPCPTGVPLQVKFGFVSDSTDVAGGFYIDDVRVGELETNPKLRIAKFTINDSLGNENGIVDPGESLFVYVQLINEGTGTLPNASGILECSDSYVTVLEDSVFFGDIQGKRAVQGKYLFETLSSTPVGHPLTFNLYVDGAPLVFGMVVGGAGVEENKKLQVASYKLQVHPNPFTQKTVIELSVGQGFSLANLKVCPTIQIYDLAGRLVKSFSIPNCQSPITKIIWDGEDDDKKRLPSGIYFVKLKIGDKFSQTKKLLLLR